MAIFLGSLNRSALRAAAQDPVDDPVVEQPVSGATWATPPTGYTTAFLDDHSQPTTEAFSWQGVDRNKWYIASNDGNPDPNNRSNDDFPFYGSNVIVKPEGGLYMYAGRRPPLAPGDDTISDNERSAASIKSKSLIVKPGFSGPRIVRIRGEWEQRLAYTKDFFSFSSWVEVTRNGVAFEHGFEHDIESRGSEYDPNARTFRPHFNNHLWQRPKAEWQAMGSQQSPLSYDVPLPSDPRGQVNFDLRWRRGSDFWDPFQTYLEWWTDEIVDGVSTGNMVRRYHWSPRHLLEERRGSWPTPSDAPPADALPPELANVAPSTTYLPGNRLSGQSPYSSLDDPLKRPYIAAYDPDYTWWDVCRDSWSDEGAGSLTSTDGFARVGKFLADNQDPLLVSDYADHHSHIDDEKAFATVRWGVVVFDPD